MKPDQVAIYIRWSTEDQGQGHTLEIQRESCRYYCLSQGWTVQEHLIFIDEGCSGGTLDRPALTRLREAVCAGLVDCVVVYRLDRLSRNIRDIINLVLGEWEEVCCVRSTQEPVDTTTDAGRMLLAMLGSFADFERSSIRTRTFSGKCKNAQKARNPGIPYPYGFRRGDQVGQFVVEPDEAAVVQTIFSRYAQGLSCRRIAAWLNEQRLRTRTGCQWYDSDIARLLRNPLYAGRLVYNRRTWGQVKKGGQVAANHPDKVVTAEGPVPAIVAPALWDEVQRLRAERPRVDRGRAPRSAASRHLLTGLLRCRCGHAMIGLVTGRRPAEHAYYCCSAARSGGPAACACGPIRQAVLDRAVLERLRAACPPKPPFSAALLESLYAEVRLQKRQVDGLALRARELQGALARFKADYRSGRITGELFQELAREVTEEQAQVQRQHQSGAARLTKLQACRVSVNHARQAYERLDGWRELEPGECKQVLRLLLESVMAFRERSSPEVAVRIDWRLPAPGVG